MGCRKNDCGKSDCECKPTCRAESAKAGPRGFRGATGATGPCCTGPTGATAGNLLQSGFDRVDDPAPFATILGGILTTLAAVPIVLTEPSVVEIVATASVSNNQQFFPGTMGALFRVDAQFQIRIDGTALPGGGGGTVVGGFTVTLQPDPLNPNNPVHGGGAVVFRTQLPPGAHTVFLDMISVGPPGSDRVSFMNPNPPATPDMPHDNASLYVQVTPA